MKRKERDRRGYNSQDSDIDSNQPKSRKMDEREGNAFKVFFKMKGEGQGFGSVSPLKLSKAIKKEIGDVLHASTMNNGSLMIICKSADLQAKALKVKNLLGKGVEGFAPNENSGVIYM